MEFGLKLDISQKLVMTPQLCQAIAVLQLSSLELAELLEKEVLENPVLEMEESAEAETTAEQSQEPVKDEKPAETKLDEYLEWEAYFNEGVYNGEVAAVEERRSFESMVGGVGSLRDHLELQMHVAAHDDLSEKIGRYLIGCLDDNGYLTISVPEAAAALNVTAGAVEVALALLQSFDPPGVAARDLKECLALQLKYRGVNDPLIWSIINKYLPDVGEGRLRHIAEQLKVTPREIQQAVDFIRTLDPKPGSAFGSGQSSYVTPDITIERVNGSYIIVVNDTQVPRLTINPYYRRVIHDIDADTRKFVEGRLNAAVWLIKSIEQRRRTLYNVAEAIVDLQRGFFDYGPKQLKPLTMKTVADRLGIHESTVSRATSNKYAATPHGLFSLRTFFTSGVSSTEGEALSASTVKQAIRELIAAEPSGQPLSDQAIAQALACTGTTISRRTVTKYREEMGIAASSKRKRY
ncbi:RNA polymerase sigma-54 factor [Anaerosporomusa subterranea]|uniref:RNA polymerase sigma-54 factor n=1 Tax=Anaerosporomusa subterranea TaxID=1794912 RepID=A0A154BSI3_ANASB|nr:RNA polymerase factor sigma-54 [Anaerosporomusa subterranea]KYZ76857.1 RNA polymerase sigma-54 factor [Anaerosporomusa subterranea]